MILRNSVYAILFACLVINVLDAPKSSAQALDHPEWYKFGGQGRKPGTPDALKGPRYPNFQKRIQFFVDTNSLPEILSANLTAACVLGNFNQRKNLGVYIEAEMPGGRKQRFGYANSDGVNLRDPDGRVADNQSYLFLNDGTSECRVYAVATLF